MERLKRKYDTAETIVPKPVITKTPGARIGIIGYGSTTSAIEEARYQLEKEHGLKTDFMRLRAVPFPQEVCDFIRSHDQVFVVEMNRGGQMHKLLSVATPDSAIKLFKVAFNDGLPATAAWVREGILDKLNGKALSPNGKKPATRKAAPKLVKLVATKKATPKKKGVK
jgi:2-oxoglutarate ferredoxin oxidoreductase subunit alpha